MNQTSSSNITAFYAEFVVMMSKMSGVRSSDLLMIGLVVVTSFDHGCYYVIIE